MRNPLGFEGYGRYFWGHGERRPRLDGAPDPRRRAPLLRLCGAWGAYGPDDGTIAPWAVVASLPFAPDVVLPTVRHFREVHPEITGKYCFKCSFNLTFEDESQGTPGWTSAFHYGINLGPIVLMIENYRSGLFWGLMRRCPHLVTGLRRAGFVGGWL